MLNLHISDIFNKYLGIIPVPLFCRSNCLNFANGDIGLAGTLFDFVKVMLAGLVDTAEKYNTRKYVSGII